MISFPSSFSKGGASMVQTGVRYPKSIPSPDDTMFENVQSKNLVLTPEVISNIYQTNHNFSKYSGYLGTRQLYRPNDNSFHFEDSFKMNVGLLRGMNNYKFIYKNPIKQIFDTYKKDEKNGEIVYTTTAASPALFNPSFGVQTIGVSPNNSLLTNMHSSFNYDNIDVNDCTIEHLIKVSNNPNSILGNARYRLIDFMYCKHLGKVSNNHLITLRKFAQPIGDHIYKWAGPRGYNPAYNMQTSSDIGRLISWFDTDDNKLEDICKYETQMKWDPIENQIEEVNSKEDSKDRGITGLLVNTFSSNYNNYYNRMGGATQNIFNALGSNLRKLPFGIGNALDMGGGYTGDNTEILRMYDKHKVYTPRNTVQDTHIYNGKLTLNQEIIINFSYTLRAYENINPKSAMLDLMGNVLEVTYQRGQYWAGGRRMIGPPQNSTGWQKANDLLDNAWERLGGFINAMAMGSVDFGSLLGSLANAFGAAMDGLKRGAESVMNSISSGTVVSDLGKGVQNLMKSDLFAGVKGMLKDQLGRPALYAMNSLISGDDCGFWHLTIGNPFNPIMCIGNLILTSSTVQHLGPLGVDDFPTELKVTVNLKPGRSRDATEISRYYTQGLNSIYIPKARNKIEDFHNFGDYTGGESINGWIDNQMTKAQSANDTRISNIAENKGSENDPISEDYKDKLTQRVNAGIEDSNNSSMEISTSQQGVLFMAGNTNPLQVILAQDEFSA